MENQVFSIRGMTCAACAQRIEKTVRKLAGVGQAGVNLASEKLFVEYDGAVLNLADIRRAVSKIGFEAAVFKENAAEADKARKEKEIQTLWMKFIISAVLCVPLLYMAMAPMITVRTSIMMPLPQALIMMMNYPLVFALLQLALMLPIVIAGINFTPLA